MLPNLQKATRRINSPKMSPERTRLGQIRM
jgi:hypothetical protein